MSEFNSSKIESIGSCNTEQYFSPPTPQFNRVRRLQLPLTAQRRLFSSDDAHYNVESSILRNCSNGESWTAVEEPVQNHSDQYEGSLCLQSYNEGRHCEGCVPSWVPYNVEGAHQSFMGHANEEDWIPLWGNSGAAGQVQPLMSGQQGLEVLKENVDDSFNGTYFDTYKWKPSTISDQQWRVLEAISQGKSVFVTGSAGTGKSYLLEYAVRILQELYDVSSVFVTASTGLAACALRGRTLHSFAGVQLGDKPAEILVYIVKNSGAAKRWKIAKALIIDEISMIDGEFFDKLDYVARHIRQRNEVFGGLQLVVTGDFFQLPPVKSSNLRKQFAFEADCWNKCFDLQIELTEVFRQGDREFISMLNEIRRGQCSPKNAARLNNCRGPSNSRQDGISLTRLYPKKVDVRTHNDKELMALNNEIIQFLAMDEGPAKSLLDSGVAPKQLYLCEGAQVMLIWNLDVEAGLVNGARGVVVGFTDSEMRESRLVSPKGLWPVVQFACQQERMVLRPQVWVVCERNEVVASRTQVPLILAWAISVHKCQGMTLDRVETDLSKAFEYGMVYVALSRLKNLEGLRLTGFDPSKIKAHPKVFGFYDWFTEEKDDCDVCMQ
eukprot:Gb_05940 [translate_table: standard]